MSWTHPALLALLAVLVALTLSNGANSAAVSDDKTDVKANVPQGEYSLLIILSATPKCFFPVFSSAYCFSLGVMKKIFMPESDAFTFFRRRSRRAVKSQDELNAEQRLRLSADERRREYNENQRSKFENYAEEEGDEQDERTRESTEQWREFHYDGLHPSYEYNRHVV
ncbi:hypothetical protein ACEWY4_010859 [Coilia grayii]|uniref:Unique cartilage matrix-associated protein n=1 Tax=Coilia grayii TaxID=363190 RepID=A0ABD1K357_9TELE